MKYKLIALICTTSLIFSIIAPTSATTNDTPPDTTRPVEITDTLDILKNLVGMVELPTEPYDFNKNTVIDIGDALETLKSLVGMCEILTLPTESDNPVVTTEISTTAETTEATTTTKLVTTTEPPMSVCVECGEEECGCTETEIKYNVLQSSWFHRPFHNVSSSSTYIIKSMAELYFVIESVESCKNDNCNCNYHNPENYILKNINEELFYDKVIILIYLSTETSSRFMAVDKIVKENDDLKIYTTIKQPCIKNDDLSYYRIALIIDNKKSKNIYRQNEFIVCYGYSGSECNFSCGSYGKWQMDWLNSKKY
jgi:hypothetical protein